MSCLFQALSYFLVYSTDEIRQKICDYLESNQPIMEGLDTKFILELDDINYVQNMRNSSQWGGGIEIQTACNLFDLRIIVHKLIGDRRTIEFLPVTKRPVYTIEITWNGFHFEPVPRPA